MPPIDDAKLATKDDLSTLESALRSDMALLRADLGADIVAVRGEIVSLGRQMLLVQLTTMVMLGAWVAAIN